MNMMQPDKSMISIGNNLEMIKKFLSDVILAPRTRMMEWSRITNQTPNLKIGYPGQHLASLITGIPGTATGARGEDIADGTEVKSCSRIDQVDKCKVCKTNVLRAQSSCPACGSTNIERRDDSKWLITIRNEKELDLYLNKIPRMFFLISDYPNFDNSDFETLRFASFEIWNKSDRASEFRKILKDYYYNIYLKHIEQDEKKTPAPKNFWPDSYQFYLCNPIKTFECIIHDTNTRPRIEITHYVEPDADRSNLKSEDLPISRLSKTEKAILRSRGIDISKLDAINEQTKKLLSLRETSVAKPQKTTYHRM